MHGKCHSTAKQGSVLLIFVDGPPQGQGCGTEGGKSLIPLLRRRIAPPCHPERERRIFRPVMPGHLLYQGAPDVPDLGTWGAKKGVKRARRPTNWDVRRTCVKNGGNRPRCATTHRTAPGKGPKRPRREMGEFGRGAQMLVSLRFKCFNGAFWSTVEKLFSLIIR